jgi:hypothetical protein
MMNPHFHEDDEYCELIYLHFALIGEEIVYLTERFYETPWNDRIL